MPTELVLKSPLAHQVPVDQSDARWKYWRAGRRTGKTEWAAKAGTDGHGPRAGLEGSPRFAGLLQGRDVAWVVPAYPQSETFWHEFIYPTFHGIGMLNASLRTVDLGTGGRLWVKSAEAIGTIRGLGANMGGVIFEESASYPTLDAFRREIRPILMDNKGWAAWIGSTKAGSEFNQIGQEILSGARSAERGWAHFHNTPYDNPILDPQEIADLIAEYPTDSDALREEVFAELLEGGAGLAFPMWSPTIHCCKDFQVPQHWEWVAGMDWGITAPSVVLLAAVDAERRCLIAREWMWKDLDAYTAGYELAQRWLNDQLPGWPKMLWCDSAMAAKTGIGGTTILEEFQAGFDDALRGLQTPTTAILPAPKGPGSVMAAYNVQRKMLEWGPPLEDGTLPPSRQPRTRVVKEYCPYLVKTLPGIRLDEKKQDQVEVGGENHAVAAWRYLLAGHWPRVQTPRYDIPVGVHPGMLPNGRRRSRHRSPEVEREEALVVAEWKAQHSGGEPIGGRVGRNARRL